MITAEEARKLTEASEMSSQCIQRLGKIYKDIRQISESGGYRLVLEQSYVSQKMKNDLESKGFRIEYHNLSKTVNVSW